MITFPVLRGVVGLEFMIVVVVVCNKVLDTIVVVMRGVVVVVGNTVLDTIVVVMLGVVVVGNTVLDTIVVVILGVVVKTGIVTLEQEELSIIDLLTFVIPTL